ncbi:MULTISPECIES: DNA primase [unclassified Solwaraspora]|uniref:DNA primase n=1 Tax=unclassified Solwaraspora TaxID=2627926 RepID=UPI00259BDF7E|nr:DNA primase [Solwaraspora sp. WMMA2056]WJK40699.1 DNA primase [Solwaraspora sp. WMMA2056]
MAKSPNQPDADRLAAGSVEPGAADPGPADDLGPTDDLESATDDTLDDAEDAPVVTATGDRSLWADVRIDPVEIALPAGVGLTLRAYRPATLLTPTDISEREEDDPFAARRRAAEAEDDDDETVVILDEEFAAELAEEEAAEQERARGERRGSGTDAASDEADDDPADDDADLGEDVPVFLSQRGKLLLFKTPQALVSFVRSGAPHDLAQLDTWTELVDRLEPADVAALPEDTYELDLVVENLRGGHDTWDAALLIQSGEVARDLAYALRMPSVLDMLSAGSSLDDLDEALRSTVDGGIGGFMARRRLKKIGAQTASLGWRTIIGKISAATDWRD